MNPTCPRRSTARRSTSLLHRLALATAAVIGGPLLVALPGCGSGVPAAPPAVTAPPPAVAGQGATTPPPPAPLAAIAAAGSANHTVYAARGMACEQCHPCGQRVAGGHAVAWMDTTSPSFHAYSADTGLAACASCHGANLDGVGGTTTVSCAQCHGATWRTTCTFCHGGTDSASGAPPRAIWGRTADAVRVGAHTAHLAGTHGLAAPVLCAACHVVPTDALSTGHVSGGTATVTFSGLATGSGATAPAWTRATATCSNTYCHGGKWTGNATYAGSAIAPSWTASTAVAGACGSCHKAPPSSAMHASVTATTNCSTCHTGYSCTTANLAACTVNKTDHLNGRADFVAAGCNTCHGSATNNAPPAATSTVNAAVKAGAHQAHLTKANLKTAAVTCAECHTVPTVSAHASGTVDMTWSGLAVTGGIVPTPANLSAAAQTAWEAAPTCTNYCHGAKWIGNATYAGSATSVAWTATAATASACGSCHKAPPSSAMHASVTATTNCSTCHTGYSCTTANLAACTVNKTDHLNGRADFTATGCTGCHGNKAQTATPASPLYAAPPTDTAGLATGGFRIGAHQKHLTGTTYRSAAIPCGWCHASVGSYASNHADGTRQVAFIGATPAALQAGTWAASTATTAGTCSNTGCHSVNSRAGQTDNGTLRTPTWTGTVTGCAACHSVTMTTLSRNHTRSNHRTVACSTCHGTGYSATAVNKATHIDGVRTVVTVASGTGIRTWNATTGTCTASCHGSETW